MDRSHDRHIIQSLLIRHSAPSSSTGSATVPGDRSVCQVIPNPRLCHTHAPPLSHLHETSGCVNGNSDHKNNDITAVTIVEAMSNNDDDVSSLVCYAVSQDGYIRANNRGRVRDTTCGLKAKDITPSIAWRREAWKEEALDDLP